jgi:glycosyltransferase involved in cell wall biosynthesis
MILPTVTIIIPARPEQPRIQALEAARALDYPRERLQVVVARGKHPSVQRNAALKVATGELICFLDDDSQPPPDLLRRAVPHFSDPAVKMVGGPNLCPPGAPLIEQAFAVVMGTAFAFGPSRARYDQVGTARATSEKELILCNLLARRLDLVALGGFDETLYPNEENALMDELQKMGGRLIYDPAVFVHRRPRPHLRAFAKMLLNYGRGRAEQFRSHPTLGSALNFAPPLFCLYLLLLGLLVWCPLGLHLYLLAPLALYALGVVGQTVISLARHRLMPVVVAMPLLVVTHVFYGLGFWRGLFTRLAPPDLTTVRTVQLEYPQLN